MARRAAWGAPALRLLPSVLDLLPCVPASSGSRGGTVRVSISQPWQPSRAGGRGCRRHVLPRQARTARTNGRGQRCMCPPVARVAVPSGLAARGIPRRVHARGRLARAALWHRPARAREAVWCRQTLATGAEGPQAHSGWFPTHSVGAPTAALASHRSWAPSSHGRRAARGPWEWNSMHRM